MLGTKHAGVSSRAKPSRQLYNMNLLCNLEWHKGREVGEEQRHTAFSPITVHSGNNISLRQLSLMDQDTVSYSTAELICVAWCLFKIRSWQRNCTSTSLFQESWLRRTLRTPTLPNLLLYLVLLKCLLILKCGRAGIEKEHWWTLLHLKLKD